MLNVKTNLCIGLFVLSLEFAAAQHETVYMAILSSFRSGSNPYVSPALGLFVSTNRGSTWQPRGWREYIRTFYSEEGSDGTIWSACGNGVLRSTDRGEMEGDYRVGGDRRAEGEGCRNGSLARLCFDRIRHFPTTDRGETWGRRPGESAEHFPEMSALTVLIRAAFWPPPRTGSTLAKT